MPDEEVSNVDGDPNVSEPERAEVPPPAPRAMRNKSSGRVVTYCPRAYASGNFTMV